MQNSICPGGDASKLGLVISGGLYSFKMEWSNEDTNLYNIHYYNTEEHGIACYVNLMQSVAAMQRLEYQLVYTMVGITYSWVVP